MIIYSKLPNNIEQTLPKVALYLQSRENVLFAYLFGSLAQKKPMPLSDVDIAVYLSEDKKIFQNKMDILGKLIDILETDEVDLVLLNNAPLMLRMKVLQNKKIIADNNPFLRHQYESLTMREYFDFCIRETDILERRFLRG